MLYWICQLSVRTTAQAGNPSEGESFGVGSSSLRIEGGIGFKNEKYFSNRKNSPYNFNALRGSNLPTYIIDDKFYLEHTKEVLNRLWGSEGGICVLMLHQAVQERYIIDTLVTLWEALKSVFGIRAKGFILWGIKRQYRGRREGGIKFGKRLIWDSIRYLPKHSLKGQTRLRETYLTECGFIEKRFSI